MYKVHLLENNECGGFYKQGIHAYIPKPNIDITTELWQYLLTLGKFEFIGSIEDKVYTIENKELFVKVKTPAIEGPIEPSLEEKVLILQQELAITQDALNEILFNI